MTDYSEEVGVWDYFQTKSREIFNMNIPKLDDLLKEISRLDRGSKVCDIGFGNGYLLGKLALKGFKCFGLDISKKNVEYTQKIFNDKILDIELKVGSVTSMPYKDGKFNAIVASDLLEHLSDDDLEKALSEIGRCLAKDGLFFITTPNNENLEEYRVICPKCSHIFHRVGHKQSFDRDRIKKILEGKKFDVIKIKVLIFSSPELPFRNLITFIKKIFNVKGQTLMVIARKRIT